MNLHYKSIPEIAALIRDGRLTSVELTEQILSRIERLDPRLNAFVTVTSASARRCAAKADTELKDGIDRGPLHGVPVAVKDIFATEGERTTSGSLLFSDWIPSQDATAVKKLKDAGAVIVGKTGMFELAAGTTGHNPFFGNIENPWKRGHDPGGSSGGSASAVASGLAFAALGTDTGCSVREPAHCCGITGFKPSFGLVSKSGVQPLVWSMDHVGVLARDARDAAIVFETLHGPDKSDPCSPEQLDNDGQRDPMTSLEGIKLGVIRRFFFDCGSEITGLIDHALEQLQERGAIKVEQDLPDIEDAFHAIETTFCEAAAIHEDALREHPEKFSDQVRESFQRRLEMEATEYINAQHFRALFRQEVDHLFSQVDFLVAPTSRHVSGHLLKLPKGYRHDVWKNTSIFNFTGQPSISVPCGVSSGGLPVGLMISGKRRADRDVLRFSELFQNATHWHKMRPDDMED